MKKYCLLILACLWIISNSLSSTERIPSIAVLTQTIIKSGWRTLEDYSNIKNGKSIEEKQTGLSRKMEQISEILWQLEEPISAISYLNFFGGTGDERIFDELFPLVQQIDKEYDWLKKVLILGKRVNYTVAIDLAKPAVSNETFSTKMIIEKIGEYVVPRYNGLSSSGILQLLTDNRNAFDDIMRISVQSPRQYLYNLFNKIAITEIKAYVVVQLSYAILEIYGEGYFSRESMLIKAQIPKILQELTNETIQATGKLSGLYWKEDPAQYRKGENYLEISRLLQGYVVNEIILNKGKSCYEKCDKFNEVHISKCQKDPLCKKQPPCGGSIYNCRSLRTIDMQICLAPQHTTRRYDYIEYVNHDVLGVKSICSNSTLNVNAWIGWCPYCMCFCDEEGSYSDRYFSLRQVVSDVKNNKVVTGIRFAKKNRIIHLQIQQGEILPYGVINMTSLEWVPVDNFKINDRCVFNKKDYLKMTWEDRAVNLDDIQVDNTNQYQQVLTGVKFFADQSPTRFNNESIHLNLKIRMTDFNFETGKLFVDHGAHAWYRKIDKEFLGHKSRSHIPMRTKSKNTSISKTNHFVEFTPTGIFEDSQNKVPAHSVGDGCEWNSNIQMEISFPHTRSKISTENLDISTRAKSRNTMVSNGDQYVAFTHTDIAKDVGQTTIPFLDSQNVVTKVPTPLVGAGLYYKSSPGYGGFIGLKIITYDFTKHL